MVLISASVRMFRCLLCGNHRLCQVVICVTSPAIGATMQIVIEIGFSRIERGLIALICASMVPICACFTAISVAALSRSCETALRFVQGIADGNTSPAPVSAPLPPAAAAQLHQRCFHLLDLVSACSGSITPKSWSFFTLSPIATDSVFN